MPAGTAWIARSFYLPKKALRNVGSWSSEARPGGGEMLPGVPPGLRSLEPKVLGTGILGRPSAVAPAGTSQWEGAHPGSRCPALPPGHPEKHPVRALDKNPGWRTILLLPFPARGLSSWSRKDCHLGSCRRDSSVLKLCLRPRCGADFPGEASPVSWG